MMIAGLRLTDTESPGAGRGILLFPVFKAFDLTGSLRQLERDLDPVVILQVKSGLVRFVGIQILADNPFMTVCLPVSGFPKIDKKGCGW